MEKVSSTTAKMLGILTKRNLVEEFHNEAKKLLDLEAGRASIPTAQALWIMFIMCKFFLWIQLFYSFMHTTLVDLLVSSYLKKFKY